MKTYTTLFFLFFAIAAMAQVTTETPAKEFTLQLSEDHVNIKPGDSRQVTISVLRSKTYLKGNVKLGTSTILPEGITLQFEPSEGNLSQSVVTLKVANSVAPNTYQIIVKGEVYNKIKGTTLSIVVSNEVLVVK